MLPFARFASRCHSVQFPLGRASRQSLLRWPRFPQQNKAFATKKIASPSNSNKATQNISRSQIAKPSAKADAKSKRLPPPHSFRGTHGTLPPLPEPGKGYPERLLIYHAGTSLIMWVAGTKLTAVLIFIFGSLLWAPGFYFSPFEATWKAPAVVGLTALPMIFVIFAIPPAVTFVHLALPHWARASQARLLKYADNLPRTAVIDITAVRWIFPRVTRLHASELHVRQSAAASFHLRRRVPQVAYDARKWYSWRPEKSFLVTGWPRKGVEKDVWGKFLGCLRRGWADRP